MGYQYLVIINFVITFILGIFITRKLKEMKLEQTIRDDGPVSHLKKQGTPSMGGLIFLIPILIWALIYLPTTLVPLVALIGYAALGIYDDLDKRVVNKSGGLSVKRKFIFQVIIGIIVSLITVFFLRENAIYVGSEITLSLNRVIYILFIIFFLIAVTNGVNFTDGLDGLVTMVTIPIIILFIVISLDKGNVEMAKFSGMVLVSLIAFLFFNFHPAKIFMGDTGSLALGALVAGIAIVLNIELLLLVFGFVYFIEVLSVMLQVGYFKMTKGKRILKMAPLHHHFELSGWSEKKVVFVFTGVSTLMSVLAYLIYILF